MSRIGKKLLIIPSGVTIEKNGSDLSVKGAKGELKLALHPRVKIEKKTVEGTGECLEVSVIDDKEDAAIWGTTRAIVANMIKGVTEGWSKSLELNGVGFKMNIKGSTLVMSLGFSHEIKYELPAGIVAEIEGNVLTISGADAAQVGQVAAEVRGLKKPEPYKGKGFRYTTETIRRKAGKAAKGE